MESHAKEPDKASSGPGSLWEAESLEYWKERELTFSGLHSITQGAPVWTSSLRFSVGFMCLLKYPGDWVF